MAFYKKVSALFIASGLLLAACGDEKTKTEEKEQPAVEQTAENNLSKEVTAYQQFAVAQ